MSLAKEKTSGKASPAKLRTKIGNGAVKIVRAKDKTLDAAGPAGAPLAEWWSQEAARRAALRTPDNRKALRTARSELRKTGAERRTAEAAVKSARKTEGLFGSTTRAARAERRAARTANREAKQAAKTARRDYPMTLPRLAALAHTGHSSTTGLTSLALDTPWPVAGSFTTLALSYGLLWLGGRVPTSRADTGNLVPTPEERALLVRLDPAHWHRAAEERGLAGTLTGVPELTPAGIVTAVRLDGKWTVADLRKAEANIRALLGCRTDLRIGIGAGKRGGWAQITLRTRSAADGISMTWTPEHKGIGVDTVTGEIVDIPIVGTHKAVAGMTNMGKSVTWRPWMMKVVADPLKTGVLLDPKRLEARLWHGKIRTEGHQRGSQDEIYQAIYDAVCELEREMNHRQAVADVTQWIPTKEFPLIQVVVEEGAAIVRMSKDKRWSDILDKLDGLFTLARATGFWIIWATQYPSRTNGGITAQVAENVGTTVALTVDSQTADRVIFGENAAEKGWTPSELGGVPGLALVKHKNRKANPVQVWHVTDDQVRALPPADAWQGPEAPEEETAGTRPQAEATSVADDVRRVLKAGPLTQNELVAATGRSKGAVSKALAQLQKDGKVTRVDGRLALAA